MENNNILEKLQYLQSIEVLPLYKDQTNLLIDYEISIQNNIIYPLLSLFKKHVKVDGNLYNPVDDLRTYKVSKQFLIDEIKLTVNNLNLKLSVNFEDGLDQDYSKQLRYLFQKYIGLNETHVILKDKKHTNNLIKENLEQDFEVKMSVTELIFNKNTGKIYVNNGSETLLRINPSYVKTEKSIFDSNDETFIDVNYDFLHAKIKTNSIDKKRQSN